jgi:Flp pilus assembly protein TadG
MPDKFISSRRRNIHTRAARDLQKGQGLVELAISLLILLILLNGIVDLGAMAYSYLALRDTAQEGIVFGSYDPKNSSAIKSRIRASADFPLLSSTIQDADISIHCCLKTTVGECTSPCASNSTTTCPGQKFTVSVNYNYPLTLPFISAALGGNTVPLRVSTTGTIVESPGMSVSCP